MTRLSYDKGTILVKGDVRVPYTTWDPRTNCYRAMALHYRDVVEYLELSKVEFSDEVLDTIPCPIFQASEIKLRGYQEEALDAWLRAGKKGTIVLPTGAGKTVVAMEAISLLNEATIVIVPTLDLVDQWKGRLEEEFSIKIGLLGGGSYEIEAVTVATYDSAYIHAPNLGNRFKLMVFDEIHHLPAPGYSNIAEMFAAPFRMGLTATYEREDGLHKELPRLVGGKVFEAEIGQLAGKHLAEYDLKIISTDLTPKEKLEYDKNQNIYLDFLRRNNVKLRTPQDFRRFVMRSGRDPKAREALLARHRARTIALNSRGKLIALKGILEGHKGDRVLIFTEYNELVDRISRNFLIPSITHKTKKEERKENLGRFRTGEYSTIVTSKVLDEGVDVPEASIGVILSGTGSKREFRQRLGRILRKKEGKRAILYEIVSKKTSEVISSKRRKRAVGA